MQLHEVSCRCGDRKKRFKMDIGPFFIDECCINKGFDHKGDRALSEGEKADLTPAETQAVERSVAQVAVPAPQTDQPKHTKPSSASFLKSLIGLKPGRGKLRDMNRDQLIKMAQERNLEVKEGATKNDLIAMLLA